MPIMEALLDDPNADLSLAAYDWFAKMPDDEATAVLIEKLKSDKLSIHEKWWAAEALGRRGDDTAVTAIRLVAATFVDATPHPRELEKRMAASNLDDGVARLLVRLAVAEAELGGEELAAVPVVLARTDLNLGRDPIVRVEAVNALASVAAEGTLDVLRDALLDEDNEIVEGAIWALQLMGAKEAVDALLMVAAPERMGLAEIALTAVVAVTGPGPGAGKSIYDLAPGQLSRWWDANRSAFPSGICHRCGRPLTLATLVELLEDPKERPSVSKEFRIITSFDCGFDVDIPAEQQDVVAGRAAHWVATAGIRYVAGGFYKYGHERDLHQAVRASMR